MSRSTTLEERKFIEIKTEEGLKAKDIAKELGLSIKTVYKWRQRLKKGALSNRKWVVQSKAHYVVTLKR